MELGAEVAAAIKPCQREAIRKKTEASAGQELPKIFYVPENNHAFKFGWPSS